LMAENKAPRAPALDEVDQSVIEVIARAMDRPVSEVKLTSSLERDLGAQSLDYLDIVFSLERKFRIQFPREDFMQRASDYFGEENLVKEGIITDFGLNLLTKGLPELDPEALRPGLKVTEVREMFVVATFARVVKQLLAAKAAMDHTCPQCKGLMEESPALPEFVCSACGTTVPLPPGDDVMFEQLVALADPPALGGGVAS
jgi:acyl carrier protein